MGTMETRIPTADTTKDPTILRPLADRAPTGLRPHGGQGPNGPSPPTPPGTPPSPGNAFGQPPDDDPDDGPADDGGQGDDQDGQDGGPRRERLRVKEADEIKLLSLPQGTAWRACRANTIHAIVSAAGRHDDYALEWI